MQCLITIADYFYESFEKDFEKTDHFLNRLGICAINSCTRENELVFEIFLDRPGLLIGKRGKDIQEITDMIGERLNKECRMGLFETFINSNLIPSEILLERSY